MRPLGLADLDDVLAVERESFADPWTTAMFEAELRGNPFSRFLGAVHPGGGAHHGLLGYVCYWMVFEEVRLMNVAVRPAHRRRGLAGHLVRRALRDGRASGATRALLEVRAGNHAAGALYRSLGFEPYSRRRAYYTKPDEDAILMRWTEHARGERREGAEPCRRPARAPRPRVDVPRGQ